MENYYLVYFVYGLVFFVMGSTVAIQVMNYSSLSNFTLAKKLWLLAAFGMTHGLSEWALVFLPIQARHLSPSIMNFLCGLQQLVIVISYLFLYHFGLQLINPRNRFITQLPNIFFVAWIINFLFLSFFVPVNPVWKMEATETWSRYLFALPASIVCSYGLFLQWKSLKDSTSKHVAGKFLMAVFVFGFYAIVAGLIVPPAHFFPASIVNKVTFFMAFGIPVEILRSLAAIAMAYFMIGGLEIFRVEMARRIEEGNRMKSICQERGRISRDLHDGIIQSIYVVGLQLENALYLLRENREEAEKQVKRSMEQLNDVVKDIRKYIMNLSPDNFSEVNLETGIRNLLSTYKTLCETFIELEVKGQQAFMLEENQCSNFYHIVQEALVNITKHSRASYVKVVLDFSQDSFSCRIQDNGQGFNVNSQKKNRANGRGIKNMFERAEAFAAKLEISSTKGMGTKISLYWTKGGEVNEGKNSSAAC